MTYSGQLLIGGSAPATPGFTALAPEWILYRAADAAPAIPATDAALGSHPCVALSSAQLLLEWINRNPAANALSSNGNNPLNFVSRSRGSVHVLSPPQHTATPERDQRSGWNYTLNNRCPMDK